MNWKNNMKKGAPQRNRAEIFLGRVGEETEDSFKFCLDGEVIVSIGKNQMLAKGLAPISNTQELYDLMIEYFTQVKK